MGLRGRFIMFAAMLCGVSFFSYILTNLFFGSIVGFIVMGVILCVGLIMLYLRQKKGLHARKKYYGTLIFHQLFVRP